VNSEAPIPDLIVPAAPGRGLSEAVQREIDRLDRPCVVRLGAMQQFHTWLDGKRRGGHACRVIGDSRTGKTIACDVYRLNTPPVRSPGQVPIVPVMYWHAPTDASLRELFIGLLEYLDYRVTKGTLAEIRERVYRLLKQCQVELILIDEAHRLRQKTLSEVRDLLRLQISVVLIGTDRLDAVLRRDEQVLRRFMACHRFHRMNAGELEETTAIWETYVLRLPESSNLTSDSMQRLLATATQGYLGLLDEILRNAATRALQAERSRIDLAILQQAAAEFQA
jgi:DNA transposition AAA+ family ATPase